MRLIPRLSNSGVAVRGRTAVARPAASAAAAPASTAASRLASSAPAAGGGFLAALCGWLALVVLLVGMPIVMPANGAEPGAVLMWMTMVAVAMAVSWWLEGRRQAAELRNLPKPRRATSPCVEAFQRRWGLAEESCAEAEKPAAASSREGFWWWPARWTWGEAKARREAPQVEEPVPCFVAFEGHDPGILEARPYTTIDAVMDAHAEAEAAGLGREDTIEHMARALRGAGRKQPASRGGAGGGWWGGQGRLRGRAGPVIEGRAARGWLPRR